MAKAKALTYDEFMDYAKAHYNKGGDGYYECWGQRQFDDYVELFGPITKRRAQSQEGMTMTKRLWYAVQETREDAWDNGTYDYNEAVQMLQKQGSGLIAVIDEEAGICVNEIEFEDECG